MESKKEKAIAYFKKAHNCSQAVVCTYCEDFNMDIVSAFRLSEGYGSGIPGLQSICGAASGIIMCAGLKHCPTRDINNTTKKDTYPCVKKLLEKFNDRMGDIECKQLLSKKDNTLIDGKKTGCIECVACACDIIEEYLYE